MEWRRLWHPITPSSRNISIYPPPHPTRPRADFPVFIKCLTGHALLISYYFPAPLTLGNRVVYPLACFFPFPSPSSILSVSTSASASFPYLCSFSALKNLIHSVCSISYLVSPTKMTPGCSLLGPSSNFSSFLESTGNSSHCCWHIYRCYTGCSISMWKREPVKSILCPVTNLEHVIYILVIIPTQTLAYSKEKKMLLIS